MLQAMHRLRVLRPRYSVGPPSATVGRHDHVWGRRVDGWNHVLAIRVGLFQGFQNPKFFDQRRLVVSEAKRAHWLKLFDLEPM